MRLSPAPCLAGDPDPDQVLPRWLHQGAGELAVEVGQTFTPRLLSLDVFMSCLASDSRRPFTGERGFPLDSEVSAGSAVISPLCSFKETGVMQSARADKTSAGGYGWSGGPESGAARPGRASVWTDSISAWHRAGRRAPAAPGKGVKSGWQGFLYLAELPLAKKHFTLLSLWSGRKSNASTRLSASQQACLALTRIYSHGILISSSFCTHFLPAPGVPLCSWACPSHR